MPIRRISKVVEQSIQRTFEMQSTRGKQADSNRDNHFPMSGVDVDLFWQIHKTPDMLSCSTLIHWQCHGCLSPPPSARAEPKRKRRCRYLSRHTRGLENWQSKGGCLRIGRQQRRTRARRRNRAKCSRPWHRTCSGSYRCGRCSNSSSSSLKARARASRGANKRKCKATSQANSRPDSKSSNQVKAIRKCMATS